MDSEYVGVFFLLKKSNFLVIYEELILQAVLYRRQACFTGVLVTLLIISPFSKQKPTKKLTWNSFAWVELQRS